MKTVSFHPELMNNLAQKYNGVSGEELGKRILEAHEGFDTVVYGPKYHGTPFDLFGEKGMRFYVIEVKASSNGKFAGMGQTQKSRLQMVLAKVKTFELEPVLLQIDQLNKRYRIRYGDQVRELLVKPKGQTAQIENIVKWIFEHCA